MKMPHTDRLKGMAGTAGKGMAIGALAGSLVGLTLRLTRVASPGRTIAICAAAATIGGAVGTLAWRRSDRATYDRQAILPGQKTLDDPGSWIAFRNQVIEIPETTEVQTIDRRSRQIEEVIVHPRTGTRVTVIRDTLRQTEVTVQEGGNPLAEEQEQRDGLTR